MTNREHGKSKALTSIGIRNIPLELAFYVSYSSTKICVILVSITDFTSMITTFCRASKRHVTA
jgi:hypothetical protein